MSLWLPSPSTTKSKASVSIPWPTLEKASLHSDSSTLIQQSNYLQTLAIKSSLLPSIEGLAISSPPGCGPSLCCLPMLNTLALFGLPITTSTHPHRSNILGVKKWAWQDETQDSGHPPPSDAKLQISNQFGSFFSKKMSFGGQICFPTSFLFKSRASQILYHADATQWQSKWSISRTPESLTLKNSETKKGNSNPCAAICVYSFSPILVDLRAKDLKILAGMSDDVSIALCLDRLVNKSTHPFVTLYQAAE